MPDREDEPKVVLGMSETLAEGLSDEALRDLRRMLDTEAFRRDLRKMERPTFDEDLKIARFAKRDADCAALIEAIRSRHEELEQALEGMSKEWTYCDPIYRFYHHSFKVYKLQTQTILIMGLLRSLMPDRPINRTFDRVVAMGTGHVFSMDHNRDWLVRTLPITTAFFHARFFLEMAVRCARLERVESPLASDLAALLYLFDLR